MVGVTVELINAEVVAEAVKPQPFVTTTVYVLVPAVNPVIVGFETVVELNVPDPVHA